MTKPMIKHNYIIHGLRRGEVVSIPTDTVYGLSCIIHPRSIAKLQQLKQRDSRKGFIILTSNLAYLEPYVDEEISALLSYEYSTITAPTTFVVPCTHRIARNGTLAVRLTTHPLIHNICHTLGQAIISTSANISGKSIITKARELRKNFGNTLQYSLPPSASSASPSCIINLLTREQYR